MIIPDVNLLVYATLQRVPQYPVAHAWWEARLNGTDEIGLTHLTLFGFIRLVTGRHVAQPPVPVETAIAWVEGWLANPIVTIVSPGPRHVEVAFRLLRELGAGGNLTTDVQLAALAIEHQAELASADADFARFKGLRWVNPL